MKKYFQIYNGTYFTVEFYQDYQKNIPALDYYNELTKKEKARFFALIARLANSTYGSFLPEHMYRLEDPENSIYALKFDNNRYLNFTTIDKKIIITNGFKKKTQKLGKREKEALSFAIKAKRDYIKRVKEETYYVRDSI
jgi:hypothetical protein